MQIKRTRIFIGLTEEDAVIFSTTKERGRLPNKSIRMAPNKHINQYKPIFILPKLTYGFVNTQTDEPKTVAKAMMIATIIHLNTDLIKYSTKEFFCKTIKVKKRKKAKIQSTTY